MKPRTRNRIYLTFFFLDRIAFFILVAILFYVGYLMAGIAGTIASALLTYLFYRLTR